MNLEFLEKYTGKIKVNGNNVSKLRIVDYLNNIDCEDIVIKLIPENYIDIGDEQPQQLQQYEVFVKSYMLNNSTPDFMFMKTWNNDVPMPLRYMCGTIEKETRGMYYMKLRGKPAKVLSCIRCGKSIVNPVSKCVGLGPECAHKLGIDVSVFTKEVCESTLQNLEKNIYNIVWEGWIPKTAIITIKEITNA